MIRVSILGMLWITGLVVNWRIRFFFDKKFVVYSYGCVCVHVELVCYTGDGYHVGGVPKSDYVFIIRGITNVVG